MKKIFVDTSGWANLVDARQEFHERTKSIYLNAKQKNAKLITTNYILAELIALLTSPLRLSRYQSIAYLESIKISQIVEIIHNDKKLDEEAWELLTNRADKTWSLVDCASFVVMNETGIADALTTDHHFEQAGFVRLLK